MKNNKLTAAVVAGVAGVAGMASIANAANLNPDGLGEVLIYPYYTVNNDLNTLLSVVNTTSDVKAVKVRFLEGDNSQEVLDFNLYLSPFDVWTAALSATATGAQLSTADNSCVPFLGNPQPFLEFAFVLDAGSDAEERERDGHFEMLEMAVVTDPVLAPSATHVNGVPANCGALAAAWLPGGQWFIDPTNGVDFAAGGLFGSAVIVDVAEGTAVSYNAEAINGFYPPTGGFSHSDPGDLLPSLASSFEQSIVFLNGAVVTSDWLEGEDAISALFMRDRVFNEFVLGSGINAKTEYVLTFPTKRFYVDPASGPIRPFTTVFNSPAGACEEFTITLYDREEQTVDATGTVSPSPPGQNPELCWEANIVDFYNGASGGAATVPSPVFGSTNVVSVNTNPFDAGWADITFTDSDPMTDLNGVWTYNGYPVTGFAAQTYTNENAQPGLLAQYAALFNHRYSRNITSATPTP